MSTFPQKIAYVLPDFLFVLAGTLRPVCGHWEEPCRPETKGLLVDVGTVD